MALLAVSHTINDMNQGAIPALLPFLIAQRGLNYTAATGVVLAATIISAIVQPLLGFFADRRPMPWLMPLGLLLGGGGLALAGLLPSYWMIILSVLVSGAGVAAYHPEGYRFANYLAHARPALGMSVFTVGGNIGFALGPLLLTIAIGAFGLDGTLAVLPGVLIMAAVIGLALPRFIALRPATGVGRRAEGAPNWNAFARVTLVIVLRASLYYGLLSFVPAFLMTVRGIPLAAANSSLTILAISGAVGTVIGGFLADRYGHKRVLITLLLLITPLLILFINAPSALALFCLALLGMSMIATFTVAVVIGQGYVQGHIGVASGITTGLAIGLGGASTPLFGLIADHFGVGAVLTTLIALPLMALAVTLTLPGPQPTARSGWHEVKGEQATR